MKYVTKFKDLCGKVFTLSGWLLFPFLGWGAWVANTKAAAATGAAGAANAGLLFQFYEFYRPIVENPAEVAMGFGSLLSNIFAPAASLVADAVLPGAGTALSSLTTTFNITSGATALMAAPALMPALT